MLRKDAFRSLMFVILSAGVLFLFTYLVPKKVDFRISLLFFILLVLLDQFIVNKRYLNNDDFVRKISLKVPFQASFADNYILEDEDPNYRVLNLTVNTFNDASTSYYHKSIGGYHGAKMKRYQELIEYHITTEINELIRQLQQQSSLASIDSAFTELGVLNMLNTKYVIINPESSPLINKNALGNAWFVNDYMLVDNADEEILAVGTINPDHEAVIDKRFKDFIKDKQFVPDTSASIELKLYKPDQLVYESESAHDQLAIFSEIYYPKGWEVKIDGKSADHFRADYILRAMVIPAGKHKIEFDFIPRSYFIGEKVSLVGSVILMLLFTGIIGYEIRKKVIIKKKED
jgi:hypothetical protein